MIVSVKWAMPSRWTFEIKPIWDFVIRWTEKATVIVDPFCGRSKLATFGNDLAFGGVDAEIFCERLIRNGISADVIVFDPPYSPRQIQECYESIGRKPTMEDTQNASLYSRVRPKLAALLKSGGIALSFGWSSCGFGREWPIEELMLVQHGGAHNDTICVAQRKPQGLF